jgi:chemotaxis family two-component system sensor histidine kinase/response regulator PixL
VNKTILVVDDNETKRAAMTLTLCGAGYTTATAVNGRDALTYLRAHAAPDLILLDMFMPEMDGWQFLKQRAADPLLAAIPVLLTSSLVIGSHEWAVSLGACGFVRMPADLETLLAEVRRCLA